MCLRGQQLTTVASVLTQFTPPAFLVPQWAAPLRTGGSRSSAWVRGRYATAELRRAPGPYLPRHSQSGPTHAELPLLHLLFLALTQSLHSDGCRRAQRSACWTNTLRRVRAVASVLLCCAALCCAVLPLCSAMPWGAVLCCATLPRHRRLCPPSHLLQAAGCS